MPVHFLLVTGFLPPGDHLLTWHILQQCLAYNAHRSHLLVGARYVAREMWERFSVVCPMYIGGSFTSRKKKEPSDIDIVLDCTGMDAETFLPFARAALERYPQWKGEHGVDVYVTHPSLPSDIRDTFRMLRSERMQPPAFRKGLAVVLPPYK